MYVIKDIIVINTERLTNSSKDSGYVHINGLNTGRWARFRNKTLKLGPVFSRRYKHTLKDIRKEAARRGLEIHVEFSHIDKSKTQLKRYQTDFAIEKRAERLLDKSYCEYRRLRGLAYKSLVKSHEAYIMLELERYDSDD